MILVYFSNELTNYVVIFRALDKKRKSWEILRKCPKVVKRFLRKTAKNALF